MGPGGKDRSMSRKADRYSRIIEEIFFKHYKDGATEVEFDRSDIIEVATHKEETLPLNIGDVVVAFSQGTPLPDKIVEKAPQGYEWRVQQTDKSRYKFDLTKIGDD